MPPVVRVEAMGKRNCRPTARTSTAGTAPTPSPSLGDARLATAGSQVDAQAAHPAKEERGACEEQAVPDEVAHAQVTERIDLNDAALGEAARDRPDCLQLLAEALSNSHPTGRFRELIRFFERAFAKSGKPLVRLLDAHLSGNQELGFSRGEVANWEKHRNLAIRSPSPERPPSPRPRFVALSKK